MSQGIHRFWKLPPFGWQILITTRLRIERALKRRLLRGLLAPWRLAACL